MFRFESAHQAQDRQRAAIRNARALLRDEGIQADAEGGGDPPAHEHRRRNGTDFDPRQEFAQLETHAEYMPGHAPELQRMGGYARLRTAIDRERRGAPGAFVVDGGDTFQGSGPAAWTRGEAVLEPFNALGVDLCVPGNWEVVYGADRFRDLMARVTCKVTAYNFHDEARGQRLFAPDVTLERSGVRVAFVGITAPTTTERQPPAQVKGIDSTRMSGLRDFVRSLRKDERADLVVAVTHTGLTVSRQIAREIPELDVILSGHTHERTERPIRLRSSVKTPCSRGAAPRHHRADLFPLLWRRPS